jgi:uncharacterized membrane protein YphA (DoxX/SURF4 family)
VNPFLRRLLATKAPAAVWLVRPLAGAVFLSAMAHKARTDWAMLLGCLFLLLVGAGPWSLDAGWSRTPEERGW